MKLQQLYTWGLVTLMAAAMALPAQADSVKVNVQGTNKDRSFRGSASVHIVVGNTQDQDDNRAFQSYFHGQQRGYDRIDPETGERLSDVMQLVEENNGNYLIISNQQDRRRSVVLNSRTKVIFEDIAPSWVPQGFSRTQRPNDYGGNFVASRIRPGDLIIAQGYLNAMGKFIGTEVRVVGHAWGWYDDTTQQPEYRGSRAWGDVRVVDMRRNEVEVRANIGVVTLTLSRGGELLYKGRQYNIDNLERGDRIVFYYDRDDGRDRDIEANRIVVLQPNQDYPRGDEPYWTDPDTGNGGWGDYDYDDSRGTYSEGRLDVISTGIFMNRITLRMERGRSMTFQMPKSMTVIDYDGTRIPIQSLRDGELLRVYYTEVDGVLFATKIVAQ